MMNSKTLRNGFTFAEVMMAVVIIGFLLTALLALQGGAFRRVVINTVRIDRFYPVKTMIVSTLMQPLKKGQKREEKRNEDLELTLVYEQKEIPGASELARFKGLYQRKVTGTGSQQGQERAQEIISYGFTPPPPPEKKS